MSMHLPVQTVRRDRGFPRRSVEVGGTCVGSFVCRDWWWCFLVLVLHASPNRFSYVSRPCSLKRIFASIPSSLLAFPAHQRLHPLSSGTRSHYRLLGMVTCPARADGECPLPSSLGCHCASRRPPAPAAKATGADAEAESGKHVAGERHFQRVFIRRERRAFRCVRCLSLRGLRCARLRLLVVRIVVYPLCRRRAQISLSPTAILSPVSSRPRTMLTYPPSHSIRYFHYDHNDADVDRANRPSSTRPANVLNVPRRASSPLGANTVVVKRDPSPVRHDINYDRPNVVRDSSPTRNNSFVADGRYRDALAHCPYLTMNANAFSSTAPLSATRAANRCIEDLPAPDVKVGGMLTATQVRSRIPLCSCLSFADWIRFRDLCVDLATCRTSSPR